MRTLVQDPKSAGVEKWVHVAAYFLKITSPVEWTLFCVIGDPDDAEGRRRGILIVDLWVFGVTIFVAILVCVPEKYLFLASIVAIYLLFEMFVALFDIVLLAKRLHGQPASIERSLILLVFNAAQLIFSFAIFYQAVLLVEPWRAIVFSFDLFGTVSRPSSSEYPGGNVVVVGQIVCDFLFIGIVVANFFSLRGDGK